MADTGRNEYCLHTFVPLEQALPWMYSQARVNRLGSFVQKLLAWLCARYDCPQAAIATWRDAGFAGSHGVGFSPEALDRLNLRWECVSRGQLDALAASAGSAGRTTVYLTAGVQTSDGPRTSAPLTFISDARENHGAAVFLDLATWGRAAMLLLERPPHCPWDLASVIDLERLTPNLPECVSVSHTLELAADRLAPADRAVAIFDRTGSVMIATSRFAKLTSEMSDTAEPRARIVPADWLEAAASGRSLALRPELLHLSFSPAADCWLVEAHRADALVELSSREFDVANKYAQGLSYKEIARVLTIAPNTVRVHLQRIFAKAGVTSKQGLRDWINGANARSP